MINGKITGIDRYYANKISDEIDSSKTDLLITSLPKRDIEFGSNEASSQLRSVAINIYLGETNLNTGDIEKSVTSFFYAKNWQCRYNSDWDLDPETNELYLTLYFQQRIERKIN